MKTIVQFVYGDNKDLSLPFEDTTNKDGNADSVDFKLKLVGDFTDGKLVSLVVFEDDILASHVILTFWTLERFDPPETNAG